METRAISEEYTEMAAVIIADMDELKGLKDADVTIGYLKSDRRKKSHGRPVLGECEKVQPKNKWAMPFDFLIIVYEGNCMGLTEEQMKILLYHELLHVGLEKTDGGMRYYVRPHDTEDFRQLLERYGYDWAKVRES